MSVTLIIKGRPSPWANQPHEGIWRLQIADQARAAVQTPFSQEVKPRSVTIEFLMISTRRGDLDNLAKPVIDTLFRQARKSTHPVACLFMCDDFHLHELILRRSVVESPANEGAIITIEFA
jgi:hypothetical protein